MSKLVFKILKPAATFHGIDYNERKCKKGKAILLHTANFGLLTAADKKPDAKILKNYMNLFCSTNTRIRNKQFHAILSCKGKSYSLESLKAHALAIIQELGYDKTPVVIYGHNDTENNHVHIVTARVGMDGKKIPHQFEGKRANAILTAILGTDKKMVTKMDIDFAMSYQFSSIAQFQLLLELKGYDVKKSDNRLLLYKYGSLQGEVLFDKTNQSVQQNFSANPQMRPVILKYKKKYSSKWLSSEKNKHSTEKRQLKTELTEFLYQKFGWQFVFFKNPKHDKPYGYAVIDHNKKAVFKGSAIISLDDLLSAYNTNRFQKNTEPVTVDKLPAADHLENRATEKGNSNFPLDNNSLNPIHPVEQLIGQAEREAEKEESKAQDEKKNRRGRYI